MARRSAQPNRRVTVTAGLRSALIAILVLVAAAAPMAAAQTPAFATIAPVRSYEIVARYPHDVTAFTEGLIYLDGKLYEGTGLNGQSQLRLVDLQTGAVLESRNLSSDQFGEGITILGGLIYQLTWKSNIAYVYDLESFDQVASFAYTGEGWGLTTDGTSLIMSNGSDQIVFRDPETFETTRTISVRDGQNPILQLNELEYIDGVIWANVWKTGLIARIDTETGEVVDWLDLSALDAEVRAVAPDADVLNGIAWVADTGTVLVTGKNWPTLFEIRLLPPTA